MTDRNVDNLAFIFVGDVDDDVLYAVLRLVEAAAFFRFFIELGNTLGERALCKQEAAVCIREIGKDICSVGLNRIA